MKRKINNLKDLHREKELLKVREQVVHSEIYVQFEKMGFNILKNTLTSVLSKFRKS